MQGIRTRLTYANVIATLALFLALSGGIAYAAGTLGKNAVKSKNIAANAVKSRNLAKNAVKTKNLAKNSVTSAKVKAGTLTRNDLAPNTLSALQVADVQASSIPNLGVEGTRGTPIPLTGTATFTPAAGKSYELLVELKGNPVDADGAAFESCFAGVTVLANGHPVAFASIFASASAPPPFNLEPTSGEVVPIALQETGQPQTLSAVTSFSEGCAATTNGTLRAVVVQLG
jgi:hypothetical protein